MFEKFNIKDEKNFFFLLSFFFCYLLINIVYNILHYILVFFLQLLQFLIFHKFEFLFSIINKKYHIKIKINCLKFSFGKIVS